jgi:16S rRNA (cytidine1402-2'-O)-methyltransferase
MAGTLFIVATPIGNLEDITHRALRILREVDLVACEDTRRTRVLLNYFGIKTKTVSYHEHNERPRAEQLCQDLEAGKNVALVSDAGTPLISDPGFRIVQAAIERDIAVVPIPGATALIAALVASGLPSDQFFFAGFLPARANARRAKLEELRAVPATLVFYEAPHRIAATLKDAREVLGNRAAAVARELTKIHEEIARGSLEELRQRFSGETAARGEMVLAISGGTSNGYRVAATDAAVGNMPSSNQLIARVNELESKGMEGKAALKKAARELGLKRAEAYRLLVAQKNRRSK